MTSGVGEYPSPKGQPGDHARVGLRLRGCRGGGQFQVLDSEVVEPGRDQRLLLRSEVGEGELLALPECRLDVRSEERRVGKVCKSRCTASHFKVRELCKDRDSVIHMDQGSEPMA